MLLRHFVVAGSQQVAQLLLGSLNLLRFRPVFLIIFESLINLRRGKTEDRNRLATKASGEDRLGEGGKNTFELPAWGRTSWGSWSRGSPVCNSVGAQPA